MLHKYFDWFNFTFLLKKGTNRTGSIFSTKEKKRKQEEKKVEEKKKWKKKKHKQRKTIGSKCRIVSPFKCKSSDPLRKLRSAQIDIQEQKFLKRNEQKFS